MNTARIGRALVLAATLCLGTAAAAKAQPFYPYAPPAPVQVVPGAYMPSPVPRPVRWYDAAPRPRWVYAPRPYAPPYAGPHFVGGHWHAATGEWIPDHWAR